MTVNVRLGNVFTRVVGFVRIGQPHGATDSEQITSLSVLRRRLTDDEVATAAIRLAVHGDTTVDFADVGVAITHITDDLPVPADIDRIQHRLDANGWLSDRDD